MMRMRTETDDTQPKGLTEEQLISSMSAGNLASWNLNGIPQLNTNCWNTTSL